MYVCMKWLFALAKCSASRYPTQGWWKKPFRDHRLTALRINSFQLPTRRTCNVQQTYTDTYTYLLLHALAVTTSNMPLSWMLQAYTQITAEHKHTHIHMRVRHTPIVKCTHTPTYSHPHIWTALRRRVWSKNFTAAISQVQHCYLSYCCDCLPCRPHTRTTTCTQ